MVARVTTRIVSMLLSKSTPLRADKHIRSPEEAPYPDGIVVKNPILVRNLGRSCVVRERPLFGKQRGLGWRDWEKPLLGKEIVIAIRQRRSVAGAVRARRIRRAETTRRAFVDRRVGEAVEELGWPMKKKSSSLDAVDGNEKIHEDDAGVEKQKRNVSEIEMMERFSKLLLGEDMSGCGKGVCTALAISNAITNLCGHDMQTAIRDLYANLPALRKLDNMLLVVPDSSNEPEFWYVDQGISAPDCDGSASFRRAFHRRDEKWWLPVPGNALAEIDVPESYIESLLPKNGRASLGDLIYRPLHHLRSILSRMPSRSPRFLLSRAGISPIKGEKAALLLLNRKLSSRSFDRISGCRGEGKEQQQ
uniref:PRONE domain-containing protein n=1 Tax=Ananas comosus var. bracteatus TaxID=296719 RepID=A0A6V7Q997_ANACO|nr:unnamed protein product [Ananas comosus var. bracteatus]